MTLPKFIKRNDSTQAEQKSSTGRMGAVPGVKHVDLLKDRGTAEIGEKPLEINEAPRETNPQKQICPICKSKICRCNNKF